MLIVKTWKIKNNVLLIIISPINVIYKFFTKRLKSDFCPTGLEVGPSAAHFELFVHFSLCILVYILFYCIPVYIMYMYYVYYFQILYIIFQDLYSYVFSASIDHKNNSRIMIRASMAPWLSNREILSPN